MEKQSGITAVKNRVLEKIRTKEPNQYDIFLHNDDFTTKNFVVAVLISVFGKTIKEAVSIMEMVHHNKKGLVGTYPHDIAITLADMVKSLAENNEFPLRCSVEEHHA